MPWLRKAVVILGLASVVLLARVGLVTAFEGVDDDEEDEEIRSILKEAGGSSFPTPLRHTRKAISSLVSGQGSSRHKAKTG